jgi:hypothetical protein
VADTLLSFEEFDQRNRVAKADTGLTKSIKPPYNTQPDMPADKMQKHPQFEKHPSFFATVCCQQSPVFQFPIII